MTETPMKWLQWAREIQALAQIGNTYAENEWQKGRYERLMEISAEIVHQHTSLPITGLYEDFHWQPGYATPKVDVRAAIFRNEKLLMVKERVDGSWSMPGGWADIGDKPSESAEREVLEETGLQVKARRLIGLYDANRSGSLSFYHAYKVVFLCEILGGKLTTSNEITKINFFLKRRGMIPAKIRISGML